MRTALHLSSRAVGCLRLPLPAVRRGLRRLQLLAQLFHLLLRRGQGLLLPAAVFHCRGSLLLQRLHLEAGKQLGR